MPDEFDKPIEPTESDNGGEDAEVPVVLPPDNDPCGSKPNRLDDINVGKHFWQRLAKWAQSMFRSSTSNGEMREFERLSLRWAKFTVGVSLLTLAAAIATGIVFWLQFREMASQTDISNISARQARRDSAQSNITTERQLGIAEQQAKSAQESVILASKESANNALRVERQLKILQDQAKATHDQADAALKSALAIQEQTEVSQRPWIAVDPQIQSDLNWLDSKQPTLNLTLSMRNLGKSIAENVEAYGEMIPVSVVQPMDPRTGVRQAKGCNDLKFMPLGRIDLFPSDHSFDQIISMSALPDVVRIASIGSGGESHRFVGLSIVGCVVYHSSYDIQPRHSYFAFRLVGPPMVSAEGKFLTTVTGLNMTMGFELGVSVPKDKLYRSVDVFARNDGD